MILTTEIEMNYDFNSLLKLIFELFDVKQCQGHLNRMRFARKRVVAVVTQPAIQTLLHMSLSLAL